MENNQEQPEELLANLKNHWLYHLMQLITFIFMGIIGSMVLGLLGMALAEQIWDIGDLNYADSSTIKTETQILAFQLVQVFSSIGAFILPILMQSAINREGFVEYSGLGEKPKRNFLIPAMAAMILAIPLTSSLAGWLNTLSLPDSMKETEELLRSQQQNVLELQNRMMKGDGAFNFILNAMVIAVFPAICEELFFRKGALKLLFNLTKNAHVSIIVSAILFALIHNEVFNFLPIFLFGVLLGYFALWSGSIWVPILAHFTNNFIALIIFKMSQSNPDQELLQEDYAYPWLLIILCAVGLFALCRWLYLLYQKEMHE